MPEVQHDLSEVLLGVAQTLTSNLDLSAVLPAILDQLANLVSFDSASIMLLEGDLLRPVAQHSVFPVNPAPLTVRTHELAHVSEAITTKQPIRIDDTEQDPRWRRRLGSSTIRCWLGVPLIVNDEVVGLLNISHHSPGHFDSQNAVAASAFAAFAAIALKNAALHQRLHDELVERSSIEAELRVERTLLAARVAEQTSLLRAANEEMVQAARMKDEFLAAMSHELHTPLNTIINMTDILIEGVYGTLNERQRRALSTVAVSGKHLLALISDVLDVARIESGKLQLLAQEVEIDHLCRASLMQSINTEKKQNVAYTIEPALTTMIADERRLRQILVNLLSNAVKFTAAGGAIGLDVKSDDARDCLVFTVWDTGIGIDDRDLRRLFRPFAQLDSSLSRKYEGTGLGLTLVHRLTALHGGSLAVTSRKDAGSQFVVRIPRRAVLETDSANIAPAPGFAASLAGKINVLETDSANIAPAQSPLVLILTGLDHASDLLAHALRTTGHRVEVLLQGAEGPPLSEAPNLIVVNSHLPSFSLLHTLQTFRRSEVLNTVPIVVLAALHLPGDRELALAAGANAYFIKPLLHQEFDYLQEICQARFTVSRQPLVHSF